METLREAYALAKANNGAPGIDGVTFEVIEAQGTEVFLEQIRTELIQVYLRTTESTASRDSQGRGKSPTAVDTRYPACCREHRAREDVHHRH
ncbi:MAG: ltrA [Gammaproteobacteria bacterium]|nr:ltrA [Gammaproteobacteria bacterium]